MSSCEEAAYLMETLCPITFHTLREELCSLIIQYSSNYRKACLKRMNFYYIIYYRDFSDVGLKDL